NEAIFRERWQHKFGPLEQWFRANNPLRLQNLELSSLDENNYNVTSGDPDKPSVLYIMNSLKFYGGVLSVFQVVNQLVLRGIRANIAAFGEIDERVLRYFARYVRPLQFSSESELLERCPSVDVCVATHWTTAFTVSKLHERNKCSEMLYFVQDYEPDFYPEGSEQARLAYYSYELITN